MQLLKWKSESRVLCGILNLRGVNSKFGGGVYKNFLSCRYHAFLKRDTQAAGSQSGSSPGASEICKLFQRKNLISMKNVQNHQNLPLGDFLGFVETKWKLENHKARGGWGLRT